MDLERIHRSRCHPRIGLHRVRSERLGLEAPGIPGEALPEPGIPVHEHRQLALVGRMARTEKVPATDLREAVPSVRGEHVRVVLRREGEAFLGDVQAPLSFREGEVRGRLTTHLSNELAALAEEPVAGRGIERAVVFVVDTVRSDDEPLGDQAPELILRHRDSPLEAPPTIVLERTAVPDMADRDEEAGGNAEVTEVLDGPGVVPISVVEGDRDNAW